MDDESYRELVREGSAALLRGEEGNWELARLTFEACGPSAGHGGDRRPDGASLFISLNAWAADVARSSGRGFSDKTAARYRKLWEFRRDAAYAGQTWTEAWDVIVHGSPEKGKQNRADGYARYFVKHATPEARRDALDTLLKEPEAAPAIAEALRLPAVRNEVSRATDALLHADKAERKRRLFDKAEAEKRRRAAEEAQPGLTEAERGLDGLVAVQELGRLIDGYLAAARALTRQGREILLRVDSRALAGAITLPESLAELREEKPALDAFVEALLRMGDSGQTELDAFVSGVLKGGPS